MKRAKKRTSRGAFYWSLLGLTLLCCAFLMVPVIQTVITGFMKNAFRGASAGFTLQWLFRVLNTYGDTIFRSIYLALSTLAVCTLVGVPAAYAMVKAGRARWAMVMEEALVLPLSVPGMAIGLGILLTWGGVTWFRHSWLFLLAGHSVFCLPFMVRSVTAVLRVVPLRDYEEAAATLGAGSLLTFGQIVVPLAMPGILSGALMVMTLSIGEFNISWMLQTPFTRTLPVGMADSYASMRLEIGSAYTAVFLVLIVPMLALMQRIPVLLQQRALQKPGSVSRKFMERNMPSVSDNGSAPSNPLHDVAEPVSVDLNNCSKTYGGTMVLHPFSLHIPRGQKVVLLGPSGCGKTTTLRIIAGLEAPDEGSAVYLGSEEVTAMPVEKRNVGMMFQHYALFPNMSVAQNVAYGLRLRKMAPAAIRRRVSNMLCLVHMEGFADRAVASLSGGQRQRVALARALAIRPRVLLLDEPLTALDALLRVSVREELDQLLSGLGITSVIVTHDQEEAMAMGDQIVVMHAGRIVQVGTPQEIYQHPATAFVAGFVGGSNSLTGKLDAEHLRLPGGARLSRKLFSQATEWKSGEVSAFFRPERATLLFGDEQPDMPRGKIISARFMGDHTRVSVCLAGLSADGEEQVVKINVPDRNLNLAPGINVTVNILPETLMLFPAH